MGKVYCSMCRDYKEDVIWSFLGKTICPSCADRGFKIMLNSSRHTKDEEIHRYLEDKGIILKGDDDAK